MKSAIQVLATKCQYRVQKAERQMPRWVRECPGQT